MSDHHINTYCAYHVHTDLSLLDSCSSFKEYVSLAKAQGMPAIAFTEHGKPLSWVSKKLMCDSEGIKYIHGVEIYLTERLEPKLRDNYHTILLAKNASGVREINRLIGLSSDPDHFYYTNRITFEEFLNISDNVIKTSACLASPLNKLPEDHPSYMALAQHYDYLEIQPHLSAEQKAYNLRLYHLSQRLQKPLIAGTDTHNVSAYKAECRKVLMKCKDKTFGNEDDFDLTWKTYDELVSMFSAQGVLPEEVYMHAIANTVHMADSVSPFSLDLSIKYPILYGTRENDSAKFETLIESRLQDKLASGVIPAEQEQAFRHAIQEEVRVFRKLGMEGFMLSMSELISWCKSQGMAIGPARGSVGGSRVAYVTDIIDLNPETWHTVFSRFCNEDRLEIGDIDVDVVESDRPAIFRYISGRFGRQHTARVGSYGTLANLATIDTIGNALRKYWEESHHPENFTSEKRPAWGSYKFDSANPWLLKKIDVIKKEYSQDAHAAENRYPELFYYFSGLLGTRVSQSVHPAGIVISPLNLEEEYGVFDKDGDTCLVIDMDELHEVGAAKYDFLVLKTVQVIRDACRLAGISYPMSHEVDWNDPAVWQDMLRSPGAIFQMEGKYAFDCLKTFKPTNIFEMSLVTAAIRPSGASYREGLLARHRHQNPSEIIDQLLQDNLGYLIYQEDTIKFLQEVCGLSGSEADNIRRAIGRKQKDRLDAAIPRILEGYCAKSPKSVKEASEEAMEFLQIIEDSASYQFGYNHSIAYCLLGYLCAWLRYYYPGQFITAFLNNAANDDDILVGTNLAKLYGYTITSPKYGSSRADYYCDVEKRRISRGVASVKFIGEKVADQMYKISGQHHFEHFMDLLLAFNDQKILDARKLDILIHIDFFSDFGNQRELENIVHLFDLFGQGKSKKVNKERIAGSYVEKIVARHATGLTKAGKEAASWTIQDMHSILIECEQHILSLGIVDFGIVTKVRYFAQAMGYVGYVSGQERDRPKLYIKSVFPVKRKRDGVQFGYNVLTQSIGSGIEGRFTILTPVYEQCPVNAGDIIYCVDYRREGLYFTMKSYYKILSDDDMEELS